MTKNFINMDIFIEAKNFYVDRLNDIDNAYYDYEYSLLESKMNFDFFDDYLLTEATDDAVNEKKKQGILAKIGDVVMGAIKKLIGIMDTFVQKFQEFVWSRKSDDRKIDELIRLHPRLKDEIVAHKKDLNLQDIKSVNDILNGTYSVINQINKGKISEPEAKSKFDKLVDFAKNKATPILSTATAVITFTVAANELLPKMTKAKLDYEQNKASLMQLKKTADEAAKNSKDAGTISKSRLISSLIVGACSAAAFIIGKNSATVNKLNSAVNRTVAKYENKEPESK